ncbi:MAG: endolytic transglycosylase MltG [Candidatus Binataceae bacterium]
MRRLRAAIVLLIVLGCAAGAFAAFEFYWLTPPEPFAAPRDVAIEKGESFRAVARKLAAAEVVRSATAMLLYGEFTGDARRIKPGDYEFKGGERIPEVMHHLVAGDFVVVTVVIPEGLTVHQIAERLEAAGLVCQENFEDAARGGTVVRALGLMPLGAEGYLFPATYRFSPRVSADEILIAMLARFYRVLTPQVENRMFELGLTARQMVTMASIVEKEAKAPGERPLIAGVFYNRLRVGMPLQSDPTAEYNLDGTSAAAAVRTPSAFNTYERAGLPPGPIANPGLSSIEAALYPARSDFLYFVARDDGTHVFSKSFNEHKRAIIKTSKSSPSYHARTLAAHRTE